MPRRPKDPVAEASAKINSALAPLEPEERRRVLDASYALWGGSGVTPPGRVSTHSGHLPAIQTRQGPPHGKEALDPADFMDAKQPKSGIERVTCLAYYLTLFRGKPKFKTKDLEELNSEALQSKLARASDIVDNATKGTAQYLSSAGGGFKQITTRGKALVEALPDRERVKTELAKRPTIRRFGRKRTSAKRGS